MRQKAGQRAGILNGQRPQKGQHKKADATADKAALSATRRSERMKTNTEPASIKAVVPK
ncbi:hypothetical protein LP417_31450 [Polaromonas sp. P1-6]|nr:hypothetical protein LP417_31450 [Polaromonas sp. P1-6]